MPNLSDLLDSDVEVVGDYIDENSLISSVSDTTSIAQTKTATARRKRKPVTMPKKLRSKNATDAMSEGVPKPAATKRKVKDQPEMDEEDDMTETQPMKTKAKSEKASKSKDTDRTIKRGRSAKKEAMSEDAEAEDDSMVSAFAQSNLAQTKSAKALPKPVKDDQVKPKTKAKQSRKAPTSAVEDDDAEQRQDDDIAAQQPPKKKLRTDSQRPQEPSYRRRGASVSDTERGDPILRRKLGDVTRKYENMEIKYRTLKGVGVGEATTNVEKIRKQCEAISETSNKLISSLKKELALHVPIAQEYRKLKKDLSTRDTETDGLRAANKDLNASLAVAQAEIKTLQARLAATRTVTTDTKIPFITAKPAPNVRSATAPSVNENAQIAQLKLDLYGDLTGLIIRNVKMEKDGDTYDCIQTGRNGTLHFKLYIDHEEAKNLSFEDVEFLYTPLLDANRDRDLIEIMPPYLSEDITFARENAAKFYARVVDTLTKKFEVVEEATE